MSGVSEAVGSATAKAKSLYEVGRLQWELGDFKSSIAKLEEACVFYRETDDHRAYLKAQCLILRMHTEMEDNRSIQLTKNCLEEYISTHRVALSSVAHYTLALCAYYENDFRLAMDQLEKALELALAEDAKEDICFAIYGLVIVYWALGRHEEALKEIYNLRVFFQVLSVPEVEISAQIMNGNILVSLKRYDEALEIFWKAIEVLKSTKSLYTYVTLLYWMGYTHAEKGDQDLARTYLMLAKQTVDPTNFSYLNRRICEQIRRVSQPDELHFDLVFNPADNSVTERKKGHINFKNQFILLDMLKLFLRNPGEVYSKEDLVKAVWRQEYDPGVHDNKIYVTIKRLRQLIEPDFDKPKYIYRAKNGYYLNRDAKISVQ